MVHLVDAFPIRVRSELTEDLDETQENLVLAAIKDAKAKFKDAVESASYSAKIIVEFPGDTVKAEIQS